MGAIFISVDEEKKQLEGYVPEKAEAYQRESARRADKLFERTLKTADSEEVILLSGGSASGKTEFYSEYLADEECIVFDSTLPSKEGAQIKIQKILAAGKRPVICAILPDDIRRAFVAFLGRERKFSARYFYKTHAGSRRTLLWIAKHYPDVEIRIYRSVSSRRITLWFEQLQFQDRNDLIEFLRDIQFSQKKIIDIIRTL